jgi:hypothetical protein
MRRIVTKWVIRIVVWISDKSNCSDRGAYAMIASVIAAGLASVNP